MQDCLLGCKVSQVLDSYRLVVLYRATCASKRNLVFPCFRMLLEMEQGPRVGVEKQSFSLLK